MGYQVITAGGSGSFAADHALLANASRAGDVAIVLGDVREGLRRLGDPGGYAAVVVELGAECLGVHAGESRGEEGGNMLGFARFRLGQDPASDLIELVRQPATPDSAIGAARAVFESAGLKVAVCRDFPGRIVDRLVRPYYNAALRRLDEGLASAADLDITLKLGLGYPEGPIALLERSGLADHHDVTRALYDALGDPAYAPARRAQVARARRDAEGAADAWAGRAQAPADD